MNGNCHFIFGAALGSACALNLSLIHDTLPVIPASPEMAALFVFGGLTGGIFPDIDNEDSYVGKLTSPVSRAFTALGSVTGKTGKNHRGIMHDGITYIILSVLSYLYFPCMIPFCVGCFSHLFLDLFNPSGIPFLFGVKHLHLGKMKSGSKESIIFTWLCVSVAVLAGIALKFNLIGVS